MNITHHPPSPPIYTSLSSLLLFSLWLFKVSFLSHHPSYSFSLRLSTTQSPLVGWIRPLQLQPQFYYHLSTFHSLFIPFLLFSTHLSVYTSALSLFCQLILVIYSIKNPSVFLQWLRFFSIHPCPLCFFCCFALPLSSLPFSPRRQTKPESKFIIYQVALKFMVLKGWIRLAASTLSLVWVLRATEIVSQIGLIMFGPGDAWGFISFPRNCFVWISRQRLADTLKRCCSLCLFQVAGVVTLRASMHG